MRLLKIVSDGEFSLTELIGDNIPPYAILSHTWGEHGDEVTFKDVVESTGKHKAGYNKVLFCGQQAAKDGLQYFWVDTCCIDKSSSAELSEAINSMFRWYRDATQCYVYLNDVSVSDSFENTESPQSTWETGFRNSRWFTRGWTLQELIAPVSVIFFSREGERLGDKKSLEAQIHDVTGVDVGVLRGTSPLFLYDVHERMSWAAKRWTTIQEDKAYSLLGIFNIHLPIIYGEGENAFIRLQEEIEKSLKGTPSDLSANFIFSLLRLCYIYMLKAVSLIGNLETVPISSSTVPFRRDRDFVEFGSTLSQIDQKCAVPGSSTALVGLGGVG
jgi:hypothetical protein